MSSCARSGVVHQWWSSQAWEKYKVWGTQIPRSSRKLNQAPAFSPLTPLAFCLQRGLSLAGPGAILGFPHLPWDPISSAHRSCEVNVSDLHFPGEETEAPLRAATGVELPQYCKWGVWDSNFELLKPSGEIWIPGTTKKKTLGVTNEAWLLLVSTGRFITQARVLLHGFSESLPSPSSDHSVTSAKAQGQWLAHCSQGMTPCVRGHTPIHTQNWRHRSAAQEVSFNPLLLW